MKRREERYTNPYSKYTSVAVGDGIWVQVLLQYAHMGIYIICVLTQTLHANSVKVDVMHLDFVLRYQWDVLQFGRLVSVLPSQEVIVSEMVYWRKRLSRRKVSLVFSYEIRMRVSQLLQLDRRVSSAFILPSVDEGLEGVHERVGYLTSGPFFCVRRRLAAAAVRSYSSLLSSYKVELQIVEKGRLEGFGAVVDEIVVRMESICGRCFLNRVSKLVIPCPLYRWSRFRGLPHGATASGEELHEHVYFCEIRSFDSATCILPFFLLFFYFSL